MDKSATDHCSYEFDYQADFTQFLEEARKNTYRGTPNTAHIKAPGKQELNWEKKNRKSWKTSLLSWLKPDKKCKSNKQPANGAPLISKPRRRYFSGPVAGNVGGRAQRLASGPLFSRSSSTRGQEEYEVPYMCLGQPNNPQKLHSYGPVYFVT